MSNSEMPPPSEGPAALDRVTDMLQKRYEVAIVCVRESMNANQKRYVAGCRLLTWTSTAAVW